MAQPTPLVYTPYTELSNFFDQKGRKKMCRPLALQYARCQDAYGYPHHLAKCQAEFEDLMECSHHLLQYARSVAIKEQRQKLYREGKLEQKYIVPPPDSISQEHCCE